MKYACNPRELNEHELCYFSALIYGLRLIDEKAKARHELVIPVDIIKDKCKPEIDANALRDFVQSMGARIAKANMTPAVHPV